ncbi:hypothetical protein [Niabella aquatica]
MNKQITISEQEIPTLVEYLKNRIEATRITLISLEKTLSELLNDNNSSDVNSSNVERGGWGTQQVFNDRPTIHKDGYDSSWTWLTKIEHLLRLHNELTTGSMVDLVLKYESDREKGTVMRSVSAMLSSKSKEGVISKRTNAKGEFVYFLPNNLNNNDDDLL